MARVFDKATFRVKTVFGHQHMLAAAHFARFSGRLENDHTGTRISEETRTKHRAYVAGAIMSCVASMEAVINEFYLEAVDGSGRIRGLADNASSLLTELWEVLEERRAPSLAKYQVALTAVGKERLEVGRKPYQNASLLVKLRNALIHYRPEWENRQKRHRNIEQRLKHLFPVSQFGGRAFFPSRCLGYGCAQWAVRSGVEFVDAFYSQLELPSVFDAFREQLHTSV